MKKIILILFLISFSLPALAYGGYYGYYGSYGSAASVSKYSSAASTSNRYHESQSSYNTYECGKNAIYCSSYKTGAYYKSKNSSASNINTLSEKSGDRRQYNNSYSGFTTNSMKEEIKTVPFRYNSLDYTKVRNMSDDSSKQYSSKCTDMGDASFCQ